MNTFFNPLGRYGGRELVSQRFGGNAAAYARFGIAGHNGIDLAIPERTPLRCIANTEGKVVEAAWSDVGNRCPALGKWIKVEHEPNEQYPHGYCTLYAHMDQPELNVGMSVSPGQYIGLSGNTGNSTGPHLHLGLQPLPRADNGYGGYVDCIDMISWDADPMPAYVSRYNPNREVQGLPALKRTMLGQFGETTEYGVLGERQARRDRRSLSPRSVYRTVKALEVRETDTPGKALAKTAAAGVLKTTWRGGLFTSIVAGAVAVAQGLGFEAPARVAAAFPLILAALTGQPVMDTAPVAPQTQIVEVVVTPTPAPLPTPRPSPEPGRYAVASGAFFVRTEPSIRGDNLGYISTIKSRWVEPAASNSAWYLVRVAPNDIIVGYVCGAAYTSNVKTKDCHAPTPAETWP